MNIQQAKEEIIHTLKAYLQKDASGEYLFPRNRQRPILLMGPPGIGKTAILEQIAASEEVALVSYTMTHHTRQSAIGLPKIVERSFGSQTYSMTEYTMSEIIGSVYQTMEQTGKTEGILFLDEINCVSETLAPTMLQFLQNKTFGSHRLPDGWLIVAAGNPPEYNKSVRDYDIVTLDRVRQLQIEPETDVFLRYAAGQSLHGAIQSYLTMNPDHFYHAKRNEISLTYVTARGWEDLSRLLISYESMNIPISLELISEYLNQEDIARGFYSYYCLYQKYGTDYAVPELLSGTLPENAYHEKVAMAAKADAIERFTITRLLLHPLLLHMKDYTTEDQVLTRLHELLTLLFRGNASPEEYTTSARGALKVKQEFGMLSSEKILTEKQSIAKLHSYCQKAREAHISPDSDCWKDFFRTCFAKELTKRKKMIQTIQEETDHVISFLTDSFGDGQEISLVVTSLTQNSDAINFIAEQGCPAYLKVCERMQVTLHKDELLQECIRHLNPSFE